MSVFRSIATGYLGAKIANTEANDRLKANILEKTGTNILTNVIPNAIEDEKIRRQNYDTLVSSYGVNAANVIDASGFTINKQGMDRLDELLKANKLDLKTLDASAFQTDFDNRYNTRVKTAEEKYNPILQKIGIDNIGGLGFNTVEALVKPEAMTTSITKDTMTDTVIKEQTPTEFGSMQLKDYLTAKPDEEFGESSQYRLRNNDIIKQAVSASGLNAKFITNPVDGSVSVTDLDEASQNKFQLVTEYSSDMFAKTPNRTDYINIGNEAATRVTALESLAKNGNNAMTNYFQSHIQKAPKVDGQPDYTSEEKVYPLQNGTLVNAREVFERQNSDLIRAYIVGSITQKNFIREKFGRGYSVFFDQIDDALDQQENS